MKRKALAMLSLAAAVLAFPSRSLAHEGHKVLGTVTAVDAQHLTVEDKTGKTVSIVLTADTKYRKPGAAAGAPAQAAAATDVQVGRRVVVSVKEDGATMTAREVMLGALSKPHAHDGAHHH